MLTKSDKKNALWNSSIFLISSVLGFVNFSINTRSFPPDVLGIFILFNAILGIGSNLDFGFGVSNVKHISEARKSGDSVLVNSIYVTFFLFFFLLGLFLFFLFIFYYSFFLSKNAMISKVGGDRGFYIFLALDISFLFRYMSNYVSKSFEGYGEYVLLARINLVFGILTTILMIVVFIFNLSLEYLSIFILGVSITIFATLFLFSITKLENLKFKISSFNKSLFRKYALYSMNLQLSFFVNSFIDPVIKYLIGSVIGLNFVTYFETGKRITDITNGLLFSAQKGLINKLSEERVDGTLAAYVNEKLYYYSKMANYYSVVTYGILSPLLGLFAYYWFGNFESVNILLMFLLPYSLINFGGCLYLVLMVEGKGLRLFFIQSLNLLCVAVFLFLTLNSFHNYLGLFGFYVATIVSIIVIFISINKSFGFDYKSYLKKSDSYELLKLNLLLMLQVVSLIVFRTHFEIVLGAFLIIFLGVFYRKIFYLRDIFKAELASRFGKN